MEKLDPKIDGSSKNIILENIDRLKTIFPDVFTESKNPTPEGMAY